MSAHEQVHLTDEQVDDYVDGVMDAPARAGAEAHLAGCERCRRLVGDTREVLALAERERVAVRAPAELWPLVAASTIHLAEVRRRVLASMRGVLLAGAIALVAATAVVTWKIARWTAAPRDAAPSAVVRPATQRGGVHAGHPNVPVPPEAPEPPRP
jgi:predicted anti-sigma-YlaC factor YlaD